MSDGPKCSDYDFDLSLRGLMESDIQVQANLQSHDKLIAIFFSILGDVVHRCKMVAMIIVIK